MDSLRSFSDSLESLAAQSLPRLFHVPSALGGRTALGFDGRRLLVPAMEAEEGEEVEILAPGGTKIVSRVLGFDPVLGLAVLGLPEARPESAWVPSPGLPGLASLVLALAWPSPDGPEARLDTIRYAGGQAEAAYIQTDGSPFPGFAGGALVSPSGELTGFILANRSGNRGWALPGARAAALVDSIVAAGFPGQAWLGVSTLPVDSPEGLLVTGLEKAGPAETGGLLVGDLLQSSKGRKLSSPEDLRAVLDGTKTGEVLDLEIRRGGESRKLSLKPGKRDGKGRGRAHHGPRGWTASLRSGKGPWDCCAGH